MGDNDAEGTENNVDTFSGLYDCVFSGSTAIGPGFQHLSGGDRIGAESDDFYGFRDYRQGDSLRRVYWKGLARGQSLQSKQYAAYADRSVWLDWELFDGLGAEQRLSHLCYWALAFDRDNEEYGLRIPGTVIPPGWGEKHREAVLRALALHGMEPPR